MKTLDDAKNGLLQYLQANPDGGSRADLIAEATQAGFTEPLLNEWLDIVLVGLEEQGYIDGPDYDLHLVAKVAAVSSAKVKIALERTIEYMAREGALLPITYALFIQALEGQKASFQAVESALQTAITFTEAQAPSSFAKEVGLSTLRAERTKTNGQIADLDAAIVKLQNLIAGS